MKSSHMAGSKLGFQLQTFDSSSDMDGNLFIWGFIMFLH